MHRPAQGQARQAKSKKENRYVIKAMSLKLGRGYISKVRKNQVPSLLTFNWSIINVSISIFRLTYKCKAGLK
jgi:hypothetical protein